MGSCGVAQESVLGVDFVDFELVESPVELCKIVDVQDEASFNGW